MKVCLCGLFLFVDELVVVELFDKLGVKLKSKILYEKIRYLVINKMISVFNGNRFMYLEFFENGKVLFCVNYCVGICCMLFYYG